jgi:DNA topoisomerase-1
VAKKKTKGLVIVESPAKAKKISSYLGADYIVMASMGHVRDLPINASEIPVEIKKEPWAQLGVNVDAGFKPCYVVPSKKKKVIQELKAALRNTEELILATDEDREGESIGWHLTQLLKPKVPVKRMVFSEITSEAIKQAIANPRLLDENLVSAQEARRILDRLFGYTLSPLLWKKISRGLSAGRVQSVAVRLLVQREMERLAFHIGSYWDLKAELKSDLKNNDASVFTAGLATLDGKRVAAGRDFDEATGKLAKDADVVLLDEETAKDLRGRLLNEVWRIARIEERQQTRKPQAPFITSTLQQEGSRKLNLTARQTMQTAQRLYEDGFITYMRTDSVHLSNEAIDAARACVQTRYGAEYLSPEPRQFVTKNKSAQEAHEAIRPAGSEMKMGSELGLNGQELALYELIWKRTAATQMADARLRFQTVVVEAGPAEFRATGRHVEFPGFFRAYVEGVDDPEKELDDEETALPPLKEGQELNCQLLEALGHETKPPARYTEATLIRTMESEGIGRPSTFHSIISTIQDRGYVRRVANQLVPTFTALAVTRLLEDYFPNLVDMDFTARMEQMLDDVAAGDAEYLPYLSQFYSDDEGLNTQVKMQEANIDPRQACTLNLEGLEAHVRVGRYGPYLEKEENGERITASIPEDIAPADLNNEISNQLIEQKQRKPQALGQHPEEQEPVFVMNGPFGPYVQLGEVVEGKAKPLKKVSIPSTMEPETISLDVAVQLLGLPRVLGSDPESGKEVQAGIGRFGPYIVHRNNFKSLPAGLDVLTIELDAALELLKQPRRRTSSVVVRAIGPHPEDGEPVMIYQGRYGPYVKHGKVNAALPKDREVDQVQLEESLLWLVEASQRKANKGTTAKK